MKAAALIVPPFLVFAVSDSIASRTGVPDVLIAVGAFALMMAAIVFAALEFFVPAFTARANYRARFKREIVSEIFKLVVPSAEYEPFQSIAQADFDASGLFNARGSYFSDDRVRGRIGATPFEAADVQRVLRTGTGQRSTTHSVFQGLFIHLDFNRTLNGTTIVQPADAGGYQIGERDALSSFQTGDLEFDKAYTVYGTNDAETRTILTPSMRQGLLVLRQRADRPVFAAFKGARAYLGVHYGRALFEPSVFGATSLETLERMAEQFTLAEAVVQELDLNTRVWGKAVDDSLLHAQPASQHMLNSPAVTSGALTESDVWKLATASMDEVVTDRDEAAPRPATTRIEVCQDADGVTIAYGLRLAFFVQILVSIICALVAIHALSELSWLPEVFGGTEAMIRSLTSATALVRLVSRFPLVALVAATLVGGFVTLMWMTRVHRVVISPDAVRIYRGLRPLPRRYARPLYERIVQLERAVHVGKAGSSGLMNPSASPMLASTDEARWVAAEMRRALRQTPTR